LRQIVNNVNTFTDADECIDFINDSKEEKTFMIVSEKFSQIIISIVHDISQVNSVYIFCGNKDRNEELTKEWSKVKGVYTDITSICETLKQGAKDCDHNIVSINFVKTPDGASNPNLDQLDSSFMYTQILKEILLTIDFEQLQIDEFLTYCREQFVGNSAELKNIDKIEKEYHRHQPIWWYTYQCFLYSMLNRALRLMEVDLIIKMGFFLHGLHNHIAALHAEQYTGQNHSNSFVVYRGQGLSQTDFDQLMNTRGGLISFNNFLSTSLDGAVSLAFAESNQYDPNQIGVLFEITVDPSVSSYPFANIQNVSYFKGEKEILFSMHSIFRIGQVKQINENNRLWQVDLILTSDNDSQLCALTEYRREEIGGLTGWHRLGHLLIKLGHFNKAEELYEILLKQAKDESEKAIIFHYLGQITEQQGKYTEAVMIYEKALEIKRKTLPANHPNLAASYNNMGLVYYSMSEYPKSLSYHEKALEIYQKILPANNPDVATSYHNIGGVYKNMGEYSKALLCRVKAHEICLYTLPANHPDLATSYNNIGAVYNKMNEYSKALSYYKKALEIREKTLPTNHRHLGTSYNNIGGVYKNMGEYSRALSYYECALNILQDLLPYNHPHLLNVIQGIEFLKKKL
jgi:tetratricopeptide (TPR) repeat protein